MGIFKRLRGRRAARKARKAASGKRLAYGKKDLKKIKAYYAGKR